MHAFRAEVHAFCREHLPDAVREKTRLGLALTRDESHAWESALRDRGWLVPHWPERWGGTGWGPAQLAVFRDELALAHAPEANGLTLDMIGPILIRFASPEQQQRFLPRILSLEHRWCQGYSEPDAGSDLASLRTRATRGTDREGRPCYVVEGSKIWTSQAHQSDWIFCLVRTDPEARKQQGISFLLIDLKSPGIRIQPIIGIHGFHLFNQVFFDGVQVPLDQRVGEENQGWAIAKSLLEFERLGLARVAENRRRLAKARALADTVLDGGQPLIRRDTVRQRLVALEVRLEALAATVDRVRRRTEAGQGAGPETGMLKLVGSQLIQDIEDFCVDIAGPDSLADERAAHAELQAHAEAVARGRHPLAITASARRFVSRGFTIAGGSSEIQHELLAKQVLGL
ncbi:MAG: acyl-CoA dehydrogenase family protein [Rubrivivax sp.]|nr:acyl-CoA dehydrogenase family protein [Rubrivivax sp.]